MCGDFIAKSIIASNISFGCKEARLTVNEVAGILVENDEQRSILQRK